MTISKIIKIITNPKRFAKTVLWRSENLIYDIKNRQRKLALGTENPDSDFYEIGFNCGWNGLGWIIIHVLEHLEYAADKKYIPVVNLRGFKNQYVSNENLDKENIWEYWFEQPAQYAPDTILKSKNVIKSKRAISPSKRYRIEYSDYKNKMRMKKLHAIYEKYVRFNENTCAEIFKTQNQLVGNKKVLGIMCRGTDFSKLKPYLHPIQPDPQDVVNEAEIVMKKYNCTHIFLSTEDKDIYDLFHKKFGDALLSIRQTRFSKTDIDNQNPLANLSDAKNRKEIAFSYLASMYILSMCPCFISGITGGSLLVKIMSDGFEYEHFYDIGVYTQDVSLGEYWKNFIDELTGKRERK